MRIFCMPGLFSAVFAATAPANPVATTADLVKAVSTGKEGDTIEIAEGVFSLKAPLPVKTGMTIKGAGAGKTIITNDPSHTRKIVEEGI